MPGVIDQFLDRTNRIWRSAGDVCRQSTCGSDRVLMNGSNEANDFGFAAGNDSTRISKLFDSVGRHDVAKGRRDRHVGNDPPFDFHDREFRVPGGIANVRAECDLHACAECDALDRRNDRDRQCTPDVSRTLKEICRRAVAGFEGIFVEAVQTSTLKDREIDAGTKVIAGSAQYDGPHVRVLSQGLARFDKRFEHGKVYGIMFVRPIERNLRNMISNIDFNSVTHYQLPRPPSVPGANCISRAAVYRFIGFLLFICFSSLSNASEYPDPGVFEVLKDGSELRVLTYPAGLFGGLGHSHVISTKDIEGRIELAEDPATSSVELTIPVDCFEVDNDVLRSEEGEAFAKKVSDKDKHGTRKNMLSGKLLDSSNFGNITVRSSEWTGELPDILVTAEFTVRDQTNILTFPASVVAKDDQIVVTGKLTLTHAQLGLEPFKAALGSIRVRDEMELKFRLTAERVND